MVASQLRRKRVSRIIGNGLSRAVGKGGGWQDIRTPGGTRVSGAPCHRLATITAVIPALFDAASRVDWAWWKGSARALPVDHASTARQSRPEELLRRKVREGSGSLADVRRRHEDLIVRFVTEIRARGYAYRTEEIYEQWVCRYLAFCGDKSPVEAGAGAVTEFLHELVVSGNVSASTQNQALNALVFLYERVLLMPFEKPESFARSKRKKLVPVVMTRSKVGRLLAGLDGWQLEVASLL